MRRSWRFLALGVLGMGLIQIAACDSSEGAAEEREPGLGANASFHGHRLLPDDSAWNRDVSGDPVAANSDALIASIGAAKGLHPDFGTVYNGAPNGIPYAIVSKDQPKVTITFTEYADQSDPGPYPIPPEAPVEGGPDSEGDRHVLVFDRDSGLLYELFHAFPRDGGKSWDAGSGAIFDTRKNKSRREGWTSADAAGLPILPGLVRYDEVMEQKAVNHALRFTVGRSRRAYVPPATHWASHANDPNLPPMGMRVRLKQSVDVSKFPPPVRVILTALKKYGMIVADNGGDWFIGGAPDPRWDDDELHSLKMIKGSDFEVVKMQGVVAEEK